MTGTTSAPLAPALRRLGTPLSSSATRVMLLGAGAVMGAVVWFAFSLAGPISRLAGRTGLNIMTRLMGLVLAALAVEFIAAGIRAYVTA